MTVLGNTGSLVKTQGEISLFFEGWNTADDGGGTDRAAGSTFTMGTTNVILYAQWSVLRGTGPAGGLIFYDKGNSDGGWRYLEAAPNDQSAAATWGCSGTLITGADGTVVGTGKQNTIDILAECATVGIAARLCYSPVEIGGCSDWFLPSKDELNLMYTNLHNIDSPIGGFADDLYWSSSEYISTKAWAQYFDEGFQGNGFKSDTARVRAVRAF